MKKPLLQKLGLLGVVSFLSYTAAVVLAPLAYPNGRRARRAVFAGIVGAYYQLESREIKVWYIWFIAITLEKRAKKAGQDPGRDKDNGRARCGGTKDTA